MGLGRGSRISIEKRVQKGKEGEVQIPHPDTVRAGRQRSGRGCMWEPGTEQEEDLGKSTA